MFIFTLFLSRQILLRWHFIEIRFIVSDEIVALVNQNDLHYLLFLEKHKQLIVMIPKWVVDEFTYDWACCRSFSESVT